MSEQPDWQFLLSLFLMEAWDTVATVEEGLEALGAPAVPSPALLENLLVVTHRLRGAAGMHGFPGVSSLAGAMEQAVEGLGTAGPTDRRQTVGWFGDVVSFLKKVLDGIGTCGQEDAAEIAAFLSVLPSRALPAAPPPPVVAAPPPSPVALAPTVATTARSPAPVAPDNPLEIPPDVLEYFGPEAAEHIEVMTEALLALEAHGHDEERLATAFRAVHTLKGAAYTVGCWPVGDLAHRIEDLLGAVREAEAPITPAVVGAVFAGIESLRILLGEVDRPGDVDPAQALQQVSARLEALIAQSELGGAMAAPGAEAAAEATGVHASELPARLGAERRSRRDDSLVIKASIRVNVDRLDALLNLVGELVIARSRLDRRLTQLERVGELLAFSRSRMGQVVREFETKYGYQQLPAAPLRADNGGEANVVFEELEFDRYDDFSILARSVAEISADVGEVQNQLSTLVRTIGEDTWHIQRLTGDLRSSITRARMVPVGRLFTRFARQVRESAREAGFSIALQIEGEAVEVDNTIVEQLADPLLHLLRNAVFHGIESAEEREAQGKPPHGTISLKAWHQGDSIFVEVGDDGRGMDPDLIREHAVQTGLLDGAAAAALDESAALDLIFRPGFSTAETVTTAAGRGVGMDVVRTNVNRLSGDVDIDTRVGLGTRFTIKVPLTVAITDALVVRVGAEIFAIPRTAVRTTLAVAPADIAINGERETIVAEGQEVELLRLGDRLGLRSETVATGRVPVAVLRAARRACAVAVDELVGRREIVIKALDAFLDDIGPFAGATISGEGRVILILDPARLLGLSAAGEDAAPAPPAETPISGAGTGRRVLLVDDSVSVRKFVGQMLERGGFQVTTAADGGDALQQLEHLVPDVIITDLEMPRVNGYDFIKTLRMRRGVRDVPVVVLTTRSGDKHVRLARQLGIEHYVAKPVDERAFVRLIGTLLGHPVAR